MKAAILVPDRELIDSQLPQPHSNGCVQQQHPEHASTKTAATEGRGGLPESSQQTPRPERQIMEPSGGQHATNHPHSSCGNGMTGLH